MTDAHTATIRTEDEQIVEQLRPYAIDVESQNEEVVEGLCSFTGSMEEGTEDVDMYILRGVRFVYGDPDDPDEVTSYDGIKSVFEDSSSIHKKIEYDSDDPFYQTRLGSIKGDSARKILDGDVDALHAISEGRWEPLEFDSREDALVNLARKFAADSRPSDDRLVTEFLSGFDLSEEEVQLVHDAIDEYRLDQNPFNHLGLDIREDEDGYYYKEETKDGFNKVFVTNFLVDVLSYLDVDGERQVRLRIRPASPRDPSYTVTVPLKVFNDKRVFLDNVVVGKTTRFDGSQGHLNDLREYVGSSSAPDRIGLSKVTIIDGHLITPNGVLTEDGWVEDSEYVYVDDGNALADRWLLSPGEHEDYDDEEVARTLELLPQIRSPERIIPTIGWFYSVGFRDLIEEIEGGFNAHNVFGQSEAGKSETMKRFGTMWGMDYEDKGLLEADISKFALESSFSFTDVAPLLFDEFKPADMSPHEVDRFKRFLRNATGGASRPKGTKTQETVEYDFKTPIAFAGEQAVTGVAETRRAIPTVYELEASRPGTQTAEAWGELTGSTYTDPVTGEERIGSGCDPAQHALAYYMYVLRQDRDEMTDLWMESKNQVNRWISHIQIENLKQMHIQGFVAIRFGVEIMNRLAEDVGLDDAPVPESMVRDTIEYVAGVVGDRGSKNDLDTLLYYCGLAARDGALNINEEYNIVHPGTEREELRINLTYAHDKVMTWANKTGKENTNLLTNPSDYRTRIEESFESDDPTLKTVFDSQGRFGMPTSDINRAVGFDISALEERIEGFSRHMFVEGETATEYADGSVSVDHVESATPISQLDDGKHTITVEVSSQASNPPAHFAEKGLLSDESGSVQYHIWAADQSDVDTVSLDAGRVYCIHNALVSDYEGETEVQIQPGISEVTEIDPGQGYTQADEAVEEASA